MAKLRKPFVAMVSALALGASALVAAIPASADVEEAAPATEAADTEYLVGAGIYDITGAVAETSAFGYAAGQKIDGLYTRLYAHAYIVVDQKTGERVAFVSNDLSNMFPSISMNVYQKLEEKYGDLYTFKNTMISATHSHSANGGHPYEKLYITASNDDAGYGFDQRNLDAVVNGVVAAIERAHNNLEPGTITVARGTLENATRNRSEGAYNQNPDAGDYDENVNPEMVQLNFRAADGTPIGLINWFGTHPTQLSLKNSLISSDSKGYAQWAYEKKMGSDPTKDKTFVAAFPTSEAGDVVSAQGNAYSAEGWGGDANELVNVKIDGEKFFHMAEQLWEQGEPVTGSIGSASRWAKFGIDYKVDGAYTSTGEDTNLCQAARGWSFAPGGENGPSNIPGVYEGMTKDTLSITDKINKVDTSFLGGVVRLAFRTVGLPFQDDCHAEKPILLPTGAWGWAPEEVPFQVFKIGNLGFVSSPAEPTTMSGRYMKANAMKAFDGAVDFVTVVPYTGGYIGYVATRAEYAAQHYEGASTEFGPEELAAFNQEAARLIDSILNGTEVTNDALPPMRDMKFQPQRPGVVYDGKPAKEKFGQVLTQPESSYQIGQAAKAEFRGAHPKNNFRTQDTFLKVQRKVNGEWVDYRTDRDFDTTYQWVREGSARSRTVVTWYIGEDTPAGTYRLVQLGEWKNGMNHTIYSYHGESNEFTVN